MALFFVIELLYAGWSSVQVKCLDLSVIESAPIFLSGAVLQGYLILVAVRDGLIFIALYRKVNCVSQRSLISTHGLVQTFDVIALFTMAIVVCFHNVKPHGDD